MLQLLNGARMNHLQMEGLQHQRLLKPKKSYHCAVQKSDVHQSYSSLPAKPLILVFLI
jgi:hypothetical protein